MSEKLIQSGRVEQASLGVTLQSPVVDVNGTAKEAAQISRVVPHTPADKAGLRQGDAVLKVDDEIVAGALGLIAQVRERPPGTKVELTIANQDGATRKVSVQFGVRPRS